MSLIHTKPYICEEIFSDFISISLRVAQLALYTMYMYMIYLQVQENKWVENESGRMSEWEGERERKEKERGKKEGKKEKKFQGYMVYVWFDIDDACSDVCVDCVCMWDAGIEVDAMKWSEGERGWVKRRGE